MKLPNAERAIVDIVKLRDYCLNPLHPEGRHKAQVFQAALGISRNDAEALRLILLAAAREEDAFPAEKDEYGQRYVVDFFLNHMGRKALVRSVWIVRRI